MMPSPCTQDPATRLSRENYVFLQKYIHAASGIVVGTDKQYLLEARLLPLLRERKIESLDALSVMLAKGHSSEIASQVIEAMTTNETLFFRDAAMFTALRSSILPGLLSRTGGGRRVRIWSAAASTGQEAYSVVMLLRELGADARSVEIVGTDLSRHALERARRGKYLQFEISRGLPPALLARYFKRDGAEWQLTDEVRSVVRFEEADLRADTRRLGSFDLILCRNVLIYFDERTKATILSKLRSALSPEGMLVLGCAETLAGSQKEFCRHAIEGAIFYRPAGALGAARVGGGLL